MKKKRVQDVDLSRFTALMHDALYNGSRQCTGTTGLWPHLNIAQAYARGIVNGTVATIMAAAGFTFKDAFEVLKASLPDDFDIEIIPESWRSEL